MIGPPSWYPLFPPVGMVMSDLYGEVSLKLHWTRNSHSLYGWDHSSHCAPGPWPSLPTGDSVCVRLRLLKEKNLRTLVKMVRWTLFRTVTKGVGTTAVGRDMGLNSKCRVDLWEL